MREFKTESKTLLGLMIHSIYAHREVFLRELISNASDAIGKARMAQSAGAPDGASRTTGADGPAEAAGTTDANRSHAADAPDEPEIHIAFDKEARILSISDTGCGMNRYELEECLGTIAHSGSRQVKDAIGRGGAGDAGLIGQFGVGFYSAFMVADQVTVISRAIDSDEAFQWKSRGTDGYEIYPAHRNRPGTDVILHIRPSTADDNFERYLDQSSLIALIKRHSDYIRYPITMDCAQERYDEESGLLIRDEDTRRRTVVNAMVPPWDATDGDVDDATAADFYRREFQDESSPLQSLTVRARGAIEYDALLFIPASVPEGLFSKDYAYGLRLYSAGVLIEENCATLLPSHLRFVRGVVDVGDIALNVSREAAQSDGRFEIIARQIERSVMARLKRLMEEDRPAYEEIYRLFGTGLKFAICTSHGMLNETLSPLLLYRSAREGRLMALQEFLDGAGGGKRPEILYAVGNDADRILESPSVQAALACGRDVMLCENGAQDELCFMLMGTFKGAGFHSVASASFAADGIGDEGADGARNDSAPGASGDIDAACAGVLDALCAAAPRPLARVVASRLLISGHNAASRIATDGAVTISMMKYLAAKAAKERTPEPRFVLEVNTGHALFAIARAAHEQGDGETLRDCATVLLGQALLAEDIRLDNPAAFNAATCALIGRAGERHSMHVAV